MSENRYPMESHDEGDRVEKKTDRQVTHRHLRWAGIETSLRAVDVGCATGAVTREMALLQPGAGVAMGLDRSSERLQQARRLAADVPSASFTRFDIMADTWDQEPFDLVWARFLLEYLHPVDQALRNLIRLSRPGGRVVAGDLDGNTIWHDPLDRELQAGLDKAHRALAGTGFDPHVGRRLYHLFHQAGLQDIRLHAEIYHLIPGAIPAQQWENWRLKLSTIRPLAVPEFGSEEAYDAFAARFREFLHREDTLTYSVLFLVSGQVP